MKISKLLLLLVFFVANVFASNDSEVLMFKAKIGFDKTEDKIIEYKFFESGKKVLLLGNKSLQIWDVENNKLLNSALHQIPQFAPSRFFDYVSLGLTQVFAWKPYVIDPQGKWIITIEKTDDIKIKSVIVRDLQTVKQIAVLSLPNISVDYVALDESKNEIVTRGETDKKTTFANWDKTTFELKRAIPFVEYKWHHFIENEQKMLVGSGDTKIAWGNGVKEGSSLTLRDVKTGAIEKEFTAANLKPETSFVNTTVSRDERFLISERNDRIFVWEINGNGQPKFEISAKNDKEDFDFKRIVAGQFIFVSFDKKLYAYDAAGNGTPKYELVSPKANDSVNIVSITQDENYIAVTDDTKASVLETAGNGKPLYEIPFANEKEGFTALNFMRGEKYFIVSRVNRSEKKPERSEFYHIETGKIDLELPGTVGSDAQFTPDKRFIYSTGLGSTTVWNVAQKTRYKISLDVHYPDTIDKDYVHSTDEPSNNESTLLSPDGKWFLRHGMYVVSIFDIETGNEVQRIFDPGNVKYNKENKVKNSGLGEAGWSEDGKYVYAFGQIGIRRTRKFVNFWELKR